jgi:putative glutamine amidotransferase
MCNKPTQWLMTVSATATSTPSYLKWLARGNIEGVPVVAATLPRDLSPFQALLLSGGGDVAPSLYDAIPDPETHQIDPARDQLEVLLIEQFRAAGKPVFGICRGIQILNVALGGKLIQHIPRWLDRKGGRTAECHNQPGRTDARHGLTLVQGTTMATWLADAPDVNSTHHQAADPRAIGRGLRVCARSPAGIIEAMESATGTLRAYAVQWHPERLPAQHPASRDLLAGWCRLAATPHSHG